MDSVKTNRDSVGFAYKPNIEGDIASPEQLIASHRAVRQLDAYKELPVDASGSNAADKIVRGSQLGVFQDHVANRPKILEMIEHVQPKMSTLADINALACVGYDDYQVPFDDPSVFDESYRAFADRFIPLVEGENELTLEWVQTTIKEICAELNMKVKDASIRLQMAVTGDRAGASGWHVMTWIGVSATRKRLTRAYFYNLNSYTV